jgi:leucyl-tRNA synthetase
MNHESTPKEFFDYQFSLLEPKWQSYWEEHHTFQVEIETSKPKYYILDMFPYPSGEGLHVGHPEGYTATDIMARYKRMKGFNVLHPMGWDSFGLPAENYAIKTGVHPEIVTKKNINNFRRQLKSIGFSYDWNREITTSNVDYYKWTQWIFSKIYQQGLAYESEMHVNWCPELKCILANEEVINGKSAIGDHPVERKLMKQWILRITEYAERLLNDLEELDWPHSVKEMQKVWIGKSEGTRLKFLIDDSSTKEELSFEVFTTRVDTLFGVSFIALSPEHPLLKKIVTSEQIEKINEFQKYVAQKSDLERTDLNKDKRGEFTGCYALHPIDGRKIPIWTSDYVLMSYGTGVVMGVPAHDQRDFEFAQKYHLPIIEVIEGGDISKEAFCGEGNLIHSQFLNGLNCHDAIVKMTAILEEKKIGKKEVVYKLRDWLFSRQRYWGEPFPLLKYEDGTIRCLGDDELPVVLPQVEKYGPSGTGESPLSTITEWVDVICPKTGKKARRETHTMPQWAGSCWYFLRFCDPHNQDVPFSFQSQKYWMPVDLYVGGTEHAVLHLLYARFWHKVLFDLGLVSTKEPFQKLVNQGLILGPDGEKMSKSRGNVVNPDTIISEFGADTLRLYEMFMGPLEKAKPWSTNGVKGVHSFLNRVYRFFANSQNWYSAEDQEDSETLKMLHKTIKKVTLDIESLSFNTAISQMMIFTNFCMKKGKVHIDTVRDFNLILSPFAPHLGEEIWHKLGHTHTLSYESWPTFDENLCQDSLVTYAVQINGKMKSTAEVDEQISLEDLKEVLKGQSKLEKYFDPKFFEIKKEIFIPKKIINFIVIEKTKNN